MGGSLRPTLGKSRLKGCCGFEILLFQMLQLVRLPLCIRVGGASADVLPAHGRHFR